MNAVMARLRAAADSDDRGIICAPVDDGGRSQLNDLTRIPWATVHESGQCIAGGLCEHGVAVGDSVAVLAGAPGEVAAVVQGVWMCGASVTMLQHPTHRADLSGWVADVGAALQTIGAHTVVVGDPFLATVPALRPLVDNVVSVAELSAARPGGIVTEREDAIAFQQLTSGSTGRPKAVAITYRNIEANIGAIVEACGASAESDVVVSWLPLYHDMGMMGFLMVPMCLGMDLVKVTPVDFLSDPTLWPRLLSSYRGTMTAAPNFGYAVLARRLRKAADGAYDLSPLRYALNGAEAVDAATLDALVAAGARFGLRRDALVPGYGMAEATLGVSFVRPGTEYVVCPPHPDIVARSAESVPPRVALGQPLPGCEVRVVAEDGVVLASPSIGELEIRGDNVAQGYRTADGFEPILDEQGWLATGDIGYLTPDGQTVICGRKKDILIVSGRNVYPEDIERSVAGVSGVRSGGVAAVRLQTASADEGFLMVAESALHADDGEATRIRREIADRVYQRLGLTPRHVHVVPAGWLPKTSSGKLRRSATSERLHAHQLSG